MNESVEILTEMPQEDRDGIYRHTFKTPFECDDVTYEEMIFDFNRLTGRDMIDIETEMQAQNIYAIAPEISRNFQIRMAARAAKIGNDVLEKLPFREFNKITNGARDFLLDMGY